MQHILWGDFETASECDLKACGTAAYAEHPSTRAQLFSYGMNEEPMRVWNIEEGEPMPATVKAAFANPKVLLYFHNVWFDRNILSKVLGINLPITRFRCSMAQALSHGLPAGLDKLGEVMGIQEDARKVKDGRRLVLLFCKPKKLKDGTLQWATSKTHPKDWAQYIEYCRTDSTAMREIVKRMPSWNYPGNETELQLWYMDQEINSRGMNIDLELANAAMTAIASTQTQLAKSTNEMTGGAVKTAGQRDAILAFIVAEFGIELPNMQKATLTRLMEHDDTPEPLRELLQVRLSTCTTSTAKYKKIVQATSTDGRLRGTIQFSGASRTQRDAGRLTQIQNYPSKKLLPADEVKLGIEALKSGCAELVGFDIMHLTTSALRYTVTAPVGRKLIVADLSNIEGRILAWLAGEEWKLEAFRDYDAGIGADIYKLAVAKAFGIEAEEVTQAQRNYIGKIIELALGYQGGVSAIVTFTLSYDLDVRAFAEQVRPSLSKKILEDADSFYDWMAKKDEADAKAKARKAGYPESWKDFYTPKWTCHLDKEVFAALDGLKRVWRQAHPKTITFWKDAEKACKQAVRVRKQRFPFGNGCYAINSGRDIGFNKGCVRIVLPSGHKLCYPNMFINEDDELMFRGTGFNNKWGWITTSPGKLAENITQALARDVFKHGQLLAEQNGYKVLITVHDELVTEVPDTGEYTLAGLTKIMATVPEWAQGLPLAAAGFEDYRYHK